MPSELFDINKCEEASAERNIIVNFSAINFCGEIFFVKESRYISKRYIKYLSVLDRKSTR